MDMRDAAAGAVAERMRGIALPDSRFGYDFSQFIPGFAGREEAGDRLAGTGAFAAARTVFVTPDNALTGIRRRLVEAGKTLLFPSYGLARGFMLLEPHRVPAGAALYAGWLEGMHHFGREIGLDEIAGLRIDWIVTGASAITAGGLRFGMGHRYLDVEWGLLAELGAVADGVEVAAIVHDAQVVDADLPAAPGEVLADAIATPTRLLAAPHRARPTRLERGLLDAVLAATPPLRELIARGG